MKLLRFIVWAYRRLLTAGKESDDKENMSSYWDNKWARAKGNWEELQSKRDSSQEILDGLKRSPGGLGRASAKKKDRKILDSGFNVGRSVQLSGLAGIQVNTTPLIEIKGDDEAARTIALTIQVEKLAPFNTQIDDAFAILEWGSGGYQAKAELDILSGIVVNINCSWLRLTVALDAGTGVNAKYGAFACYADSGIIIPNQRSLRRAANGSLVNTVVAGGGSSAAFAIPDFARAVRLFSQNDVPYSLDFETEVGIPVGKAFFTTATGSNYGHKSGVPVKWNTRAKRVIITNLDPVVDMFLPKLMFDLCI